MMELKNDCQVDYIKEAFDKLYNRVMPFIDSTQFADARTAFQELDKKVHSEIYILKKCLAESDRAVDAGLVRSEVLQEKISDLSTDLLEANNRIEALRRENDSLRETPFDTLEALKKENSELKTSNERLNTKRKSYLKELFEARIEAAQYKKSFMEHYEENDRLRGVIDGKEKEINTLKKRISELEKKNADDEIRIKSLERANSVLRRNNGILWAKMEEFDISKRPWHVDGNAMTGECIKSLAETIEFQNKKIEELEAEKVGKEHKENVDLSPGHEFEFGDEVFVPWSDEPYMYIKSGQLYNPRTERLVYVGKDQHLKWFGEKFSIV